MTLQTPMNGRVTEVLARARALPNFCEHLLRRAVRDNAGPSCGLLAAHDILRPGQALEAVNPVASHRCGVEPVPDGACRELVKAAACEPASLPQGHEPEGLSAGVGHRADADHEVGGRNRW